MVSYFRFYAVLQLTHVTSLVTSSERSIAAVQKRTNCAAGGIFSFWLVYLLFMISV